MDDCISRQAAIDAVRKCSVKEVTPAFMLVDKAEVMTELMMLPSAPPEMIIRCKDCEYWDGSWNYCRYHGCFMFEEDGCNSAERRTDETD